MQLNFDFMWAQGQRKAWDSRQLYFFLLVTSKNTVLLDCGVCAQSNHVPHLSHIIRNPPDHSPPFSQLSHKLAYTDNFYSFFDPVHWCWCLVISNGISHCYSAHVLTNKDWAKGKVKTS
jgi:hypothetical protein